MLKSLTHTIIIFIIVMFIVFGGFSESIDTLLVILAFVVLYDQAYVGRKSLKDSYLHKFLYK